jgi:hypothetical protein
MGHYSIDGFVIKQQETESCAMISCKVELTSNELDDSAEVSKCGHYGLISPY